MFHFMNKSKLFWSLTTVGWLICPAHSANVARINSAVKGLSRFVYFFTDERTFFKQAHNFDIFVQLDSSVFFVALHSRKYTILQDEEK